MKYKVIYPKSDNGLSKQREYVVEAENLNDALTQSKDLLSVDENNLPEYLHCRSLELKPISELVPLIEQWANEKSLLVEDNAPKQYLKFLEEVGETARAILKNDVEEIKDGFGDIAVTIIILASQLGIDVDYTCSWDDIERRKQGFDYFIDVMGPEYVPKDELAYLQIVARSYGYNLTECLNIAWNTIKNRTGKTENGIFKKD